MDEDLPVDSKRRVRPETFAKLCDVHWYTVKRWIKAGIIPSERVGRVVLIDKDKALRALARHERKEVVPKPQKEVAK
jgi:excisionase family DNA binding protein